jgi:hypothetical protein
MYVGYAGRTVTVPISVAMVHFIILWPFLLAGVRHEALGLDLIRWREVWRRDGNDGALFQTRDDHSVAPIKNRRSGVV